MPLAGSAVTIEGHAIVSENGMIAAADGTMPPALRSEADWRFFQSALDGSALVVLGRLGHANHPNPGRRRLVLTRSVSDLSADPADPHAMFWNPAGVTFADALIHLKISSGRIAITGGTGAFDLFTPLYDQFVLAEVRKLTLIDGIPCFSKGHPRYVLPGEGLVAGDMALIDPGVVQTIWRRR